MALDNRSVQRFLALTDMSRPQQSEQMNRRADQLARITAELDSHAPIVSARVRQHRYLPPAVPPKKS